MKGDQTNTTHHFFTHALANSTFPTPTLLDVTLRDGSFPMNFRWTAEGMECVVRALVRAALPVIELGYYGGLPQDHFQGDLGLTGDLPLSLIRDLTAPYSSCSTRFAVMIHLAALRKSPDFQALRAAGIHLVRLVYVENQRKRLQSYLQQAREAGLQTSLNLTQTSRYRHSQLLQLFFSLVPLSPDIIYVADTHSAFYPHHIAALFDAFSTTSEVALGFHAHDFLSLAFANGLTAAGHGAQFVDCSILGLGRGAGNLRTELWCIAALSQQKGAFQVDELIPAIEYIQQQNRRQTQDLIALIAGAYNFAPPEEQAFRDIAVATCDGNAEAWACASLRLAHASLTRERENLSHTDAAN